MTAFVARTTTRKSGVSTAPFAANAFWRLLILTVAFGLFIMLLIGRMATLALFESTRAFGATTTDYIPERGDIVDRNGVPLARSIYGYAIWVKPADILGNKKELATQLAAIFPDTPAAESYAKLTADKSDYLRRGAAGA
jgi:cell division protein FtsI (penicillin-binding protein 3)